MSKPSPEQWSPPIPDFKKLENAERALFIQVRAYLLRNATSAINRKIANLLGNRHVHYGAHFIGDANAYSPLLHPEISYSLHDKQREIESITGKPPSHTTRRNIPAEMAGSLINRIHKPLRQELAASITRLFLDAKIHEMRRHADPQKDPKLNETLRQKVLDEYGPRLKGLYEDVRTGNLPTKL